MVLPLVTGKQQVRTKFAFMAMDIVAFQVIFLQEARAAFNTAKRKMFRVVSPQVPQKV